MLYPESLLHSIGWLDNVVCCVDRLPFVDLFIHWWTFELFLLCGSYGTFITGLCVDVFPFSLCQFLFNSALNGSVSLPFGYSHSPWQQIATIAGLFELHIVVVFPRWVLMICVFLVDLPFVRNHVCSQIGSWHRRRSSAKRLSRGA